jgi:hypothetical protein
MTENNPGGKKWPSWTWMTGIVLIAGLVWVLLTYVETPVNNDNAILTLDNTFENNWYNAPADTLNEVKEFIHFISSMTTSTTNKKFTEQGLIKLQSAISYLADNVDSSNDSIEVCIDALDRSIVKIDTSSRNYLNELKPAFTAAVKAMESIQRIYYPGMTGNISALKAAESSIEVNRSVSSQIDKIRLLFDAAGKTLENMRLAYTFSAYN